MKFCNSVFFLKDPLPLQILPLLKFWQQILQTLYKHSQSNYKGPLEAWFLNLPSEFFRTTRSQNFIEKSTCKKFCIFRGDWGWKSKIRLLEAICNLVVSVCAKFEECATKTVGGVGFSGLFFASEVLLIPRSRLPQLSYRLEI